jgi:hypothetical protein
VEGLLVVEVGEEGAARDGDGVTCCAVQPVKTRINTMLITIARIAEILLFLKNAPYKMIKNYVDITVA